MLLQLDGGGAEPTIRRRGAGSGATWWTPSGASGLAASHVCITWPFPSGILSIDFDVFFLFLVETQYYNKVIDYTVCSCLPIT